MTIIKTAAELHAQLLWSGCAPWQNFAGTRRIRIEELTFVREDSNSCWIDLSSVTLGSREHAGSWR